MNITIRKPKLDEWEQYKKLRLESLKECPTAFASSYEENKDQPEAKWETYIERSLNSDGSIMLCAYDDEKMVGMMVSTWEDRMKTAHIAHINGVYVKPEYRGQGLAGKLYKELLKEIRGLNRFHKVVLQVTAKNKPAFNFYKKLGFEQTGLNRAEILFEEEYYDTTSMEMFL